MAGPQRSGVMQTDLGQFGRQLQQGVQALYTVHGDEPLLVQEALDALRAAARAQGYTERMSFTVAGAHFDWSEVLAAAQARSLFADKQLLELRIPSGKPGKDGAAALQQLARAALNDDATVTVVLLPRVDRATQSSAWFQALESGVMLAVVPVERRSLAAWIGQRLALQGQRVAAGEPGQRCLQFFADRVEGNLLAAHQEIVKLGLLYEPGELSFEQVEQAVLNVARFDVFKLSEAVLGARWLRSQRMLDGLQAEGESEVLVHYSLSEDIRSLLKVKQAMGRGLPLPMALREQRVWGPRERLFERVLPGLSAQTLGELLHAAHEVDGVVKGLRAEGWPAQPWQALHRLAEKICEACQLALAPAQGRT